ncbi:MAG TPA: hypothetical protein VJ728_05065 [Candidatus Binataceae bacterium]|nr:hypothetical protein [Candidatus Binataceae bacterium]
MNRRSLLKSAALLVAASPSTVSAQTCSSPEYFPSFPIHGRLDQGPFDIEQDEGWRTALFTSPSEKPLRNPGLGLVGYTWEENGPSLAVRAGKRTLADQIEQLASLPFVDVLYIRCDWRNVQSRPGRLDLDPVWPLTIDAAKRHGLRVAFRIQLSNPEFQPQQIALPDFLRSRIPLVNIGHLAKRENREFVEPRYDHPEFRKAFTELNHLLAAEFDGNPLIEWMDIMQYGFWGEGHTSNLPNPFPDYATAERTFVEITNEQLNAWKKTPLAVNTQPDISHVGNRRIIDMAIRGGAWLRSDSIIIEEPIQIDQLANRPSWLAAILEDGYFRQYDTSKLKVDSAGVNEMENYMLHTLDLRSNYWSLWTESDNLRTYYEKYSRGFDRLRANLGYRLRPAWVWQRKRYGTSELIVCVANRGVAGVPGVLWLTIENPEAGFKMTGSLDPGHPYGGGVRECSFILPQGFAGTVRLSAQLEIRSGVMKQITWACEQPLNSDGSINVEVRRNDDPNWRKGV